MRACGALNHVSRFPWKDVTPALAALIGVGVAWGVARGVLNEGAGAVVNAAAGAAVAAVVAWTTWRARHAMTPTSGVELAGELRSALMDRVRSRWIGMRDDSGKLMGEGKLAQDLALGNELAISLERSKSGGAASPKSLVEAWRSAGHCLVLTGAPGTGKSVQLLLLAEMLLNDAGRDLRAGVPVILGLPAWRPTDKGRGSASEGDRPFEEWLVTEIHARFRIPKENSRTWLAQGDLIPILDGLDEATADHRRLLFEQIVEWAKDEERPPAAWALGCREQEYAELDPNYDLMGPRGTFWSVKAVSDEERVRFLGYAVERVSAVWQPVVDALQRGEARHLTRIDEGEAGVLATPLGLTIAVEAYQPSDLGDPPMPAELLDPGRDWDRLWTRYAARRYLHAHSDPGDEGEIKQRYSFEDARRWLATLASEEIGIGTEIDLIHIQPPDHPSAWVNFWSFTEELDRLQWVLVEGWLFCVWIFVAFGTLIGWRGWGGAVGFALVLALVIVSVVTLKVAGFPKYAEDRESRKRGFHQYIALAVLCGLPGLLTIASGSFWPGAVLARLISLPGVALTRLIQLLLGVDIHLQGGGEFPAGAGGGLMTGMAVSLLIAGLAWLVYGCAELAKFVMLFRKGALSRYRARRTDLVGRYFWWLDPYDLYYYDEYYNYDELLLLHRAYRTLMARHFVLRWWYWGSPIRSGKPTGLVPPPEDWDIFLAWAAYRGYLRRVGDQYVWLHETLRLWFRKYLDSEALAALGK